MMATVSIIGAILKNLKETQSIMDRIYIGRYNLAMGYSISRLVRKTIYFSKCNEMANNHIDLFQCYNNLRHKLI
ncbi:MAG: hypothetical protein EF812_00225 [Methanosarcinales archaeon]|nr:MAG: hypothetical protein EF812_00225 [Methanosarcinales archaeon]